MRMLIKRNLIMRSVFLVLERNKTIWRSWSVMSESGLSFKALVIRSFFLRNSWKSMLRKSCNPFHLLSILFLIHIHNLILCLSNYRLRVVSLVQDLQRHILSLLRAQNEELFSVKAAYLKRNIFLLGLALQLFSDLLSLGVKGKLSIILLAASRSHKIRRVAHLAPMRCFK